MFFYTDANDYPRTQAGLDATSDAAHAVAAIRAQQMFEEMCQ